MINKIIFNLFIIAIVNFIFNVIVEIVCKFIFVYGTFFTGAVSKTTIKAFS